MSMGSRLSDLRKHNGLTRKELAEKLNMPETTLRNYELGSREPGHTFLIQIATLFDVTVDYLLELTDSEHGMYSAMPTYDLPEVNPVSENEIRLILATRLKECRERAGLTIKEAGDAIGKSEKTISAWEHGRGQPDADMLFKLCTLYGIHDIGIFYGRSVAGTNHGVSHLPFSSCSLSSDEDELITLYRSVNEDGQHHILESAKMVAGNPAMKKESIEKAT